MALQPGAQFGRYQLVSRLGRGGMAETWRARLLGAAGVTKPVLIKRVLSEYSTDEAFTTMFVSEARISATLSHGNIAQVYDFGRLDEEYFLAMEFVDGQPLNRILKRALRSQLASIPVPLAAFIALEMCRGLHYAHTRTDDSGKSLGIVHRDISPDNVIISYEGQVKIVDFGIAKARELRGFNTEPGIVKGKFLFFSPEQAHGEEVDARTDVWATGVVLYEMLCGRLPVEGPQYVALPKLVRGEFPRPGVLNADLPAELNAIVMKALAVDREERFESCHAFGDALAGFLYSTAPRFSAMSLAHFVQELFREDLASEGRSFQVPRSFLEQLALWRGAPPPTAPLAPQPLQTQPLPPPEPRTPRTSAVRPARTPPRGVTAPAPAPPPRMTPLASAVAGAAFMGSVLAVGLVMTKEEPPPVVEDPSRPQPLAVARPVAPRVEPPAPSPRVDPPAPAPQLAGKPPRGSARYPISSVVLEAQRDLIDVTGVPERLPLSEEASYRIYEPKPPPNAPPLFFYLSGSGARAEDSVGVLSRQPRQITRATGLKVFALAPMSSEEGKLREVMVENLKTRGIDRLLVTSPDKADTSRAFELTMLDEKAAYQLELLPMAQSAYTRGQSSGPVGNVACARLSDPGFVPEGVERGQFQREQQLFLPMETKVVLSGATGLLCGFIDSEASDNLGEVRLRITQLNSQEAQAKAVTEPAPVMAAPTGRPKPSSREQAMIAHDDAHNLFRAKRYDQAIALASKCLELDPGNAKCHMLMAASYARLSKHEQGAKHYREFLRYAPKDDPNVARVRELLSNYEKQQLR